MTSQNNPREQGDLDRSAADIIDAFRLTIRLLNALAPVADQVRALQETLLDLQTSALGSITPGVRQLPAGTEERQEPAEHLPPAAARPEPPEPARESHAQPVSRETEPPAPSAPSAPAGSRPQFSFPSPGINRQGEMTGRPEAAEWREQEPSGTRSGGGGSAGRTTAGEARAAEEPVLHQNPATGAAVAAAPRPEPAAAEFSSGTSAEDQIEAREEPLGRPVYATPATENGAAGSASPAAVETATVETPSEERPPAHTVAEPSSPAPSAPQAPAEPASSAPAQAAGAKRTVSVTVSRNEGPLDLVRVHGALESVPGVTGLALTSYTRGRAGILLETDRPPADLDLGDALGSVFPEGVNGNWEGENEYVAVIGEPEEAS